MDGEFGALPTAADGWHVMSGAADPAVAAMAAELALLRAEVARLRGLLGLDSVDDGPRAWAQTLFRDDVARPNIGMASIDRNSTPEQKIGLFRSRFAGREDIHAVRWENERTGKSGWSPVVEGGSVNARRPDRVLLPLTDDVIEAHLSGRIHAGLYPLLRGDACRLLVCDFDDQGWLLDALAYFDAARAVGIHPILERSRSGDGGHVWIFFAGPVAASAARRIGVHLLREAMTVRGELDLASYDRLFPAQDFMPKGSFGNLIALPLQGACRKRGTTVFLDRRTLEPPEDPWAALAATAPVPVAQIGEMAKAFGDLATGPDAATYRRPPPAAISVPVPDRVSAVSEAMLAIDRIGMPPALLSALKHLGSVHNPEFYEKERLRLSTWNTPRLVRCYRETLDAILLPRGLREKAERVVADAGSRLEVCTGPHDAARVEVELAAVLSDEQAAATAALADHEVGMLVAPPGSGKTVIGCALIARHRVPTLVIVDRKPLVDQWRQRLLLHTSLTTADIGHLGSGRRKQTGVVDIAMVQSLGRMDDLAMLTARYGFVIVDECHHVPAVTFERAVREIAARRWVGLTATPYRRDGLHAIMAMHLGPIRHRMTADSAGASHTLELVVHPTRHSAVDDEQHIQAVFRGLVEDTDRTKSICADVAAAALGGRNSVVLTRWTEHLNLLAAELDRVGVTPVVLHGQLGVKARRAAVDALSAAEDGAGIVLLATASLIGEGFDCPALDTLFLAFPIRFKGSVVQYVGRVLRPTASKTTVQVHDYVDVNIPVLARMHHERRSAYAALGFALPAKGK